MKKPDLEKLDLQKLDSVKEKLEDVKVLAEKLKVIVDNLLELGNRYAKTSDWKDFAMVKFCLCAMGVMIGVLVRKKSKKKAFFLALLVFVGTYIPLMKKVMEIYTEMKEDGILEAEEG